MDQQKSVDKDGVLRRFAAMTPELRASLIFCDADIGRLIGSYFGCLQEQRAISSNNTLISPNDNHDLIDWRLLRKGFEAEHS